MVVTWWILAFLRREGLQCKPEFISELYDYRRKKMFIKDLGCFTDVMSQMLIYEGLQHLSKQTFYLYNKLSVHTSFILSRTFSAIQYLPRVWK